MAEVLGTTDLHTIGVGSSILPFATNYILRYANWQSGLPQKQLFVSSNLTRSTIKTRVLFYKKL